MRYAALLVLAQVLLAQTPPPPALLVSPSQLRFDDSNLSYSQSIAVTTESDVAGVDVSADGGSATAPSPPWLEIGSKTLATPGRVRVSVDLSRRPVPGTYRARILFRQARSNAAPVAVTVSLELKLASPSFSISPRRLEFVGQIGVLLTGQYLVLPPGITCGEVTARTTDSWLSVAAERIPDCNRFLVSARPAGGSPGTYKGTITLAYKEERITVRATGFLLPAGPWLDTSAGGFQFEVRQGNGSGVTRNLTILNRGTGTLSWRARDVFGPTAWLSLGAVAGTATANADGRLPITATPGPLPAGAYHAVIEIAADGARNSPELFTVVMRIFPADTPPIAAPSPSGLLFSVVEGSAQSASQTETIFVSSTQPVTYKVSPQPRNEGATWLLAAPVSGVTSTGSPARFDVAVQPGTNKPGVYQGEVNVYLSARGSSEVRSVNVTMVIRPRPKVTASVPTAGGRLAENCTPSRLAPTHTGLVNNFSTSAGWPTPINLRVVDDCGDQVNSAQAVLSFSNGDAPLVLTNLLNGNYAGTWVPRSTTSPVTIRADVAQGALSASIELAGNVSPTATPVVSPDGVVNNFDRQAAGPLAPGTLIEIYGSNLSGGTAVAKLENNKLPETLNDVSVVLGGSRLPLIAIRSDVLNAQIRMETAVDQQLPIVVRVGNAISVPVRVPILAAQPGLLAFADTKVIAQDENAALISATNPAKRGRFIVLYLVGMGVTSPPVESGGVSPGPPGLASAAAGLQVTLGGKQIQVLFAGMTPSVVGLYQINVVIPTDATPGELPLVVRQGLSESNEVIVPVQ